MHISFHESENWSPWREATNRENKQSPWVKRKTIDHLQILSFEPKDSLSLEAVM